jgi:lipoprotein NlpD
MSLLQRHSASFGDTLFSIAWPYGIDHRQLAATNKIASPYELAAGQKSQLS